MKKHIFLIPLCIPLLSTAQFTTGDKFIGGTISLSQSSSNWANVSQQQSFSATPFMGFIIHENLAIGGQLGYSYHNTIHNKGQLSELRYTTSGLSMALILRRYIKIADKFVFAINGSFKFSKSTETRVHPASEITMYSYQLAGILKPVFLFFPSPKWGFEASIGSMSYNYSRNLSTGAKQNYLNAEYGSIYFGVAYYIRKSNE